MTYALKPSATYQRDLARRAERDLDWGSAADHWAAAGELERAEACSYIRRAIEKGDKYRARVRELTRQSIDQGLGKTVDEIYRQANQEVYGHA